ncbi:hypothetical protein PV327_008312 [Microctonus hyperodae]|uniref:Uncharacterized protein n=1 Tax=Microctonus hyperodae TaxID=165561 RepID=A0AA39F2W2_MICHY|nr:hypothetical protein PV327_008312 [Microctonus hyperodae]
MTAIIGELANQQIVGILWTLAITVAATSPSDNVGQIAKVNENQPGYLYKYPIENEDRVGQDKIETRSDELVNGQYYINNNQSSTDVKYFADEWGYHPVVKYTTSDGRSSINSAHLTFDNHPIYELYNKTTSTNNGIEISTKIESNIHSLESTLPPIIHNANIYKQSINNIDLTNDGVFKRDESTESPNQYSTVLNSLKIKDPLQQDETINNYSTSDLHNSETGDESSATTENIILKETAGIFGQRIQQYITQLNTTTDQTNPELSYTKSPANENGLEIHPETSSSNYKRALNNLRKYLEFHSTNKFETHNEEEKNPQIEEPVLLNDTNISYINSLSDIKTIASDKITSLNGRFSRPIVVAEITNTEQSNYGDIIPCNGEDTKLIASSTISVDTLPSNVDKTSQITRIQAVTPRLQQQPPYVTTSSIVLNSIQAGVALVNADKADLIVGNVEPSVTAIVNEKRFNENAPIDTSQPLKNIERDATSQSLNIPPTINPTFSEYEVSTKTSQLSLADDESVEIQKSLELYHSSPVHEIHYPAQLMPQVTSIDQQQRQEPYQTTQKHENAKQTFERNVESYEEDIGLPIRDSNALKYQSIVNPSTLPWQELQTTPGGNDPSLVHITDNEKKVYDNNVEHFNRPLESYDSQDDHLSISTMQENASNEKNSFLNTRLNSELYLPYDTKNVYHIIEPNETNNNVKSLKEASKSDITMDLHPRTQSILQRLLTESSDVVHHLEVDKLNNRDKHLHQRHPQSANELRIASGPDYSEAEINLTQRQIPIFTSEQYIDATSIIDNTIPLIKSQPLAATKNNQVSSNIDNNTIYIYTPKINNEINNIRDYGQSLKHSLGKYFDNSVNRQSAIRPFSYPVNSNRISEKHVPYALQPYPIASAEKIIEKKMVPYPIHKLVAQPYPIHIVQPYTVEKSVKNPAVTYQNIVTKNGHIPHGYPLEIPIKISYPMELTKQTGKTIPIPYGMQYGLNYQHLLDQHSHKLHDKHRVNSLGLTFPVNMSNQNNQDYIYINPVIPFVNLSPALSKRYGSLNQFTNSKQYHPRQQSLYYQPSSKKLHSSHLPFQTHTTINIDHQTPLRWHVTHSHDEKFMNKNTEYLGPVPVLAQHALNLHQQNQVVHPAHQETFQYSTGAPTAAGFSFKRLKLPETHYRGNTGNFRQSKMEYGFKPPMIPSIQYDEQTAMKVEN